MEITSQDEQDDREHSTITTQAEQAQQREQPMPRVNRHESMDPLRRLGLEVIRQAIKDLKAKKYKGKDPDPDPMKWIQGEVGATMHVDEACKIAEVSVRRLRERAREVVREANGPLPERDHATREELAADTHDWVKTDALEVNTDTVKGWVFRGKVTALKVGVGETFIRVDERLRESLEDYRQHYSVDADEVPPLEEMDLQPEEKDTGPKANPDRAAELVYEKGYSHSEAGEELGVASSTIGNYIREYDHPEYE